MLLNLLLIIILAVAVLCIVAASRPDEFRLTRSVFMRAPADKIFPEVNNHRKFGNWSPWAKMEPHAQYVLEGPEEGVGAIVKWRGKKTGEGISTIITSRQNELVQFRLEFLKPFKAVNTAEFTFVPEHGGTRVSWSMYGHASFLSKLMGLIMNCEKMLAKQFDQGLADLKLIAEAK